MAEGESNVKLTSSDGKEFAVSSMVANMSVSVEGGAPFPVHSRTDTQHLPRPANPILERTRRTVIAHGHAQ